MTQEQATAQDERAAPEGEDDRPPLTRSERHRVVAGVCGGLGRHLDIDPVVFRVVVAVLCLTGGLGLFLYGLAWLIVPTERTGGSQRPEAEGGGHGRTELQRVLTGRVDGQSIGAVLLTVIGTGVFFSWMGSGDSALPLLLLGAMIFFAVRYDPERRRRARGLGSPPRPGGPYDRPPVGQNPALADWKTWREDFHADWTARKAGMHAEWATRKAEMHAEWAARMAQTHARVSPAKDPSGTAREHAEARAADTVPADLPPTGATGYLWDPRHPDRNPYGGPYGASPPPGAPPQPWWQRADLPVGDPLRKSGARRTAPPAARTRRPRSFLAPLGLLLSTGAAWAVWSTHARLGTIVLFSTVLATGLLGLGLTMLVGAKFGRARVLAVPALLITMTLAVTGSLRAPIDATVGDRTWAPASASAVPRQYGLGVGDMVLDLSAVDPAGGTVATTARLGVGHVHVTVPPDVDVALRVRSAAGNVHLPDRTLNGALGTDRTVRLTPLQGLRSKGTIDLTIEVGLGDVEVVQG